MSNVQTERSRSDSGRDNVDFSSALPAEDVRTIQINRVAWGAILAGVVLALVTQILLSMIGLGVGVSTLNPASGDNPTAASLSIGAGLWFVISGVLASLMGGYVAGRLSGTPRESTASWHGLTTWGLTTLVIFYLLTSTIGSVAGGAYSMVAGAIGGAGKAIGSTAETAVQAAVPQLANVQDPFGAIESQMRESTGSTDPAAMRDAAVASLRAALTGNQAQAEQARGKAAEAISKAQGIPIDQARAQVQQYEQQYRQTVDQAKEQATKAADVTAKAVSRGALFGSLALLLGAMAGWFGGRMGTVVPTLTSQTAARDGAVARRV